MKRLLFSLILLALPVLVRAQAVSFAHTNGVVWPGYAGAPVYSSSAIGTNLPAVSDYLTVNAKTYTFTNAPTGLGDVATNATLAGSWTNLYLAVSTNLPNGITSVAQSNSTNITFIGQADVALSMEVTNTMGFALVNATNTANILASITLTDRDNWVELCNESTSPIRYCISGAGTSQMILGFAPYLSPTNYVDGAHKRLFIKPYSTIYLLSTAAVNSNKVTYIKGRN